MKLLKTLSEAAGVPGSEGNIRKIITKEVKNKVDKLYEDNLGNLIAVKKSKSKNPKKVMIAAHMDEIGFYVKHIDSEGFLRIVPVGGFDPRNLFAREVEVHSKKGVLIGLLNPDIPPIHVCKPEQRKTVPTIDSFYIDLGLSGKKVKSEVEVGDMVTLKQGFKQVGELYSGKCLDNRCCVWLAIRFLQKLKKSDYEVHVVFSVQEEVGLRGAGTAAFKIEPDLGINLDTTLGDSPFGVAGHNQISKLGEGVAIKVLDAGVISDARLVTKFKKLAKQKKIKHQLEVLTAGGTDTAAIQRSRGGVKSIGLSVPTRYIHTVTECIHPKDLDATLKLLLAYLQKK